MSTEINMDEAMQNLGRLFQALAHDDAVAKLIEMYSEDYQRLLQQYKALYVSRSANAVTKKGSK